MSTVARSSVIPLTLALLAGCDPVRTPIQGGADGEAGELPLSNRMEQLELLNPTSADFLVGDRRFRVIRLALAALPITLTQVVPTDAGAVVTLSIGNLTSGTMEGLSGTVYWGPLSADSQPQVIPSQSREVEVASQLKPGRWTTATFRLDGVEAASIQFLRLENVELTHVSFEQ